MYRGELLQSVEAESFRALPNEKNKLVVKGMCLGDEILPSYVGIIMNHSRLN